MTTLDATMLGVLALSTIVGLFRGLVFELLSLAGWFVAYFAARWLTPSVAPHIPFGGPGSTLNQALAFASAFLVVMLVWGLAARTVSALIGKTPLKPLDRLLGALFGVLRGGILLLVLATVVGYTPVARTEAWRDSIGAAWLNTILRGLVPLVPDGAPPWVRIRIGAVV